MPLTFEQAVERQTTYASSNPHTKEALASVAFMTFMGASATGKNVNMELVGGHNVGSRTTRELRPGDWKTSSYELDPVLKLIELGIPVQYAAIEELRNIYFTLASDYKPGLNVKDIDRKVVASLSNAGFGKVLPVGVVAPAREFDHRFVERFGNEAPSTILGRLDHAAKTTQEIVDEWCHDPSKLVIVSTKQNNTDNTLLMRDFANTGEVDSSKKLRALTVGKQMLTTIHHLEKHYAV
jgi:hypothetical protein